MKQGNVYIAAPFFSEEEIELVDSIKESLLRMEINVFSPKDESGVIDNTKITKEQAQEIFKKNIEAIDSAGSMVAVIDNLDPGTMFEIGYAHKIGIPIISISGKGYGLNIMLAFSIKSHYETFEDFEAALAVNESFKEWEGEYQ